jgi:hypothetical protein
MDRRIFGALKARARADFTRRLWQEGAELIDHEISADIMAQCWASIPPDHVQKVWNIA